MFEKSPSRGLGTRIRNTSFVVQVKRGGLSREFTLRQSWDLILSGNSPLANANETFAAIVQATTTAALEGSSLHHSAQLGRLQNSSPVVAVPFSRHDIALEPGPCLYNPLSGT